MGTRKHYGFEGSKRAFIILVVHWVLLFFGGTLLCLREEYLPLLLTSFLVLLWVPLNFVEMCLELESPDIARTQKLQIVKRMVLVVALCAPFAGPGLIFSHWVSDTGFRLTRGNALQASTLNYLTSKDSIIKPRKDYPLSAVGFVKFEQLPGRIQRALGFRPYMIAVTRGSATERHLSLAYGLGWKSPQLIVGGPEYKVYADNSMGRQSLYRQMWPGVYYVSGEM